MPKGGLTPREQGATMARNRFGKMATLALVAILLSFLFYLESKMGFDVPTKGGSNRQN